MKIRYRFTGRHGGRYYWQTALPVSPGDSRYEQISCPVDWFWQPPADVCGHELPADQHRPCSAG